MNRLPCLVYIGPTCCCWLIDFLSLFGTGSSYSPNENGSFSVSSSDSTRYDPRHRHHSFEHLVCPSFKIAFFQSYFSKIYHVRVDNERYPFHKTRSARSAAITRLVHDDPTNEALQLTMADDNKDDDNAPPPASAEEGGIFHAVNKLHDEEAKALVEDGDGPKGGCRQCW